MSYKVHAMMAAQMVGVSVFVSADGIIRLEAPKGWMWTIRKANHNGLRDNLDVVWPKGWRDAINRISTIKPRPWLSPDWNFGDYLKKE